MLLPDGEKAHFRAGTQVKTASASMVGQAAHPLDHVGGHAAGGRSYRAEREPSEIYTA